MTTVERSDITRRRVILPGGEQKWPTTTGLIDKVEENFRKAMGA